MEALYSIIPPEWVAYVTLIVTICAALATALPAPKPTSGTLYRIVYSGVQWVACNFGKARNAQDQTFTFQTRPTYPADGRR